MKRGVLCMLLCSAVLAVGLATLFLCSENRANALRLDSLHRECQNLILRNQNSRIDVQGHRPGELVLDEEELDS